MSFKEKESDEVKLLLHRAIVKAGSVSSLARNLDVSRTAVTNWLDEKSNPTLASVLKLINFVDSKEDMIHG